MLVCVCVCEGGETGVLSVERGCANGQCVYAFLLRELFEGGVFGADAGGARRRSQCT